ncbi:UNVERIFIED_ORG: type I restriction enzyme S subunit [Arthrobacter globiformis]|nr:type I restriction enzyme S subunit [Arthrobacter globiformis]
MKVRRTIDEVCTQIVDCEHKTAPVDPNGEYFAVGTPAMRGNVINYDESRRISKDTFLKWTRRMLPEPGDLLFAREAPVGPVVLIPNTGNVAPGQRTMLLRPDATQIDSRFLFYLLASPRQQKLLLAKASGSTVAHLNVADVRAFELPVLPELGQQQAIAEILGALDGKIAANTKLAETAMDLAATHFRMEMLGATERYALGEVLSLEYGKSLPTSRRVPGPVDVFGSGGIVGTHSEAFCPEPGVIVGRKGTAGAVHWSHRPFFPIDTTFYVAPRRPTVSQVFGYFLLRTLGLQEMNNDSAVPGLNRNQAHASRIVLPSEIALQRFTTVATKLFATASQAEVENATLRLTRDALLPKLMSGKLQVSDAKKVLEDVGV